MFEFENCLNKETQKDATYGDTLNLPCFPISTATLIDKKKESLIINSLLCSSHLSIHLRSSLRLILPVEEEFSMYLVGLSYKLVYCIRSDVILYGSKSDKRILQAALAPNSL